MSKNLKEIEKQLEKQIEKKLELKEKREIKEIKEKEIKEPVKEKIEIKEHKDIKEKPERKEFKEPIKEKVEVKEIKEFDKQVPEKGGKELVETVDPGDIFQTRSVANQSFTDAASAVAKPKETDKAFKEIEKVKPEKEVPEKIQKEIEKIKPEKENPEKIQKEIEKVKPEKEFSKHELKDIKIEKIEHKELKYEIKEHIEKVQQKDFLPEKYVFENDPKGIVENPQGGIPSVDPATRAALFSATGSAEDRLAELEDAVARLSHFIGVDLRPDLSSGALKGEPDVSGETKGDETKADDKNKKAK